MYRKILRTLALRRASRFETLKGLGQRPHKGKNGRGGSAFLFKIIRARVRMRDLVLTATLLDATKKWQFPISNNNLGPGDA